MPEALLTLVALLASASQVASAGTVATPRIDLVAHLALFDRTLSSGRMWPGGEPENLGRGFRCPRVSAGRRQKVAAPTGSSSTARRICGRVAEARFRTASVAGRRLRLELRPPSTLPSQQVQVTVNRTDLGRVDLQRGWQSLDLELPPSALHSGNNLLRLRFQQTGPGDAAVAARIRRLEVVASGSPPESGSPAVDRTAGPTLGGRVVASTDGASIRMYGDAVVRIVLQPRVGARFRSQIAGAARTAQTTESLAGQAPLPMGTASVEIRYANAAARSAGSDLYSATTPGIDVDLSRWADQPIMLSLRTTGPPGSMTQWQWPELLGSLLLPGVTAGPLPAAATASTYPRQPDPRAPTVLPDRIRAPTASADRIRAPHLVPGTRAPDIIMILLDAARRDAMSIYGASRPTPAIDRLAGDGIVYDNAFSTATWTAPAVASILTGLPVREHGVEEWATPVRAAATLPERLAAAGYHTALWSQHVLWHANPSLRRGFEDVMLVDEKDRDRLPSPQLLADPDRPTFALVHVLLPHAPYEPPPRFRGRYAGGGPFDVSPTALRAFGMFRSPAAAPQRVAYARDRYDEMMAWADDRVASLLDGLRASGQYERSLIILAGDHGEAFYEHGRFLHTLVLEREVTGIPLILKPPEQGASPEEAAPGTGRARQVAAREQRLTSLVDLTPTIAAAAGAKADPSLPGFDLLGEPRSTAARVLRMTARGTHGGQQRLALVTGDWHLIYDPAGGDLQLYNVRTDASETTDLARRRPLLAAWMAQAARAAVQPVVQ